MHYCRSRQRTAAPGTRTIRVSRSSTTVWSLSCTTNSRTIWQRPHLECFALRLMRRLTHRTSWSSSHAFGLWTMLLFALHKSPREYQRLQYFNPAAVLCKRIDFGHIISEIQASRNKMTDLQIVMVMYAQKKRSVREKYGDTQRHANNKTQQMQQLIPPLIFQNTVEQKAHRVRKHKYRNHGHKASGLLCYTEKNGMLAVCRNRWQSFEGDAIISCICRCNVAIVPRTEAQTSESMALWQDIAWHCRSGAQRRQSVWRQQKV